MSLLGRFGSFALLLGDALFLVGALFIAVLVRQWGIPSLEELSALFVPFLFLFSVWILVFFISDLYGKQAFLFESRLPGVLWRAQIANSLFAVLFFYLLSSLGVTPKTILFLVIVTSSIFMYVWRVYIFRWLAGGRGETILLVDNSPLSQIVLLGLRSRLPHARITLISPTNKLVETVFSHKASVVAMSLSGTQEGSVPPSELLFANIRFVDVADLYEELFGRIPEEVLDEAWVLRSLSENKKNFYEFFKRCIDIVLASVGALLSLPLYPFVALLIKLEDGGSVFIKQIRVGRGDSHIVIWKFRTMHTNDEGKWLNKEGDKRVTKVGTFLRKSRIDELPQLWNVLGGSLSLIGPRPELPRLVSVYEKEIPYYRLRHLVVPGLSGWAQIHHESPPHSIIETREKLTYDLYYIKHRSLFLDATIILQTIRILLSRTGL